MYDKPRWAADYLLPRSRLLRLELAPFPSTRGPPHTLTAFEHYGFDYGRLSRDMLNYDQSGLGIPLKIRNL